MISSLILAAMMATNLNTSLINTNGFISLNGSRFNSDYAQQPKTLEVEMVGYYDDYKKVYFHWTNLVCTTQFKPIVTESNGVYVIRFQQPQTNRKE